MEDSILKDIKIITYFTLYKGNLKIRNSHIWRNWHKYIPSYLNIKLR